MAEQIIKLLPTNRFSERAVPTNFTGSKLLDFLIPGSGSTYDLSKSYININASIIAQPDPARPVAGVLDTDRGLYSNEISLVTQAGAEATVIGCASLVRNAQMFSQNRGMVESIRRVDTLRQVLYNLENDEKEIENGLNKFGSFLGRRGPGNRTTSMQNTVIVNTVNGVVDATKTSYDIPRDFRIPLSDLFGVGNAMWNSAVYGDTRINLELNINKLIIERLGGDEEGSSVPVPFDAINYGDCKSIVNVDTVNAAQNKLILGSRVRGEDITVPYLDFDLNMPFHVGQAIIVSGLDNQIAPAGVIKTLTVGSGGTGYVVGEWGLLIPTPVDGTAAHFQVLTVTAGVIDTVQLLQPFTGLPGLGHAVGDALTTPATGGTFTYPGNVAGAGAGATFTVATLQDNGSIMLPTNGVPTNAGTGYAVGDTGTFTGGTGNGATYLIITETAGAITRLTITDPGQGYSNGDVLTGVVGGAQAGTGTGMIWTLDATAGTADGPEALSAFTTATVIIDAIEVLPIPTLSGSSINITTRTPWYTSATGRTGATLSDISIQADLASDTLSKIQLNKAEIVLSVMNGVNGPSEIDYRTYTTDEQTGNGMASFFHQYQVEGEAQNMIVALVPHLHIAPIQPFDNYRIAIDNVDQTGNRSVDFNSNLYQDRALRFFRNRGQAAQNMTLSMKSTSIAQADGANQLQFFPILETLPISALPKTVNLHIEATQNEQVILYKEVARTI